MKKSVLAFSIITIMFFCSSFKDNSSHTKTDSLKLTKITDGSDVTSFIYKNGLLIKTISVNPDNDYSSVIEYIYEKGKIKKRFFYDLLSNGTQENLTTIIYNYTGNLITSDINNTGGIKYSNVYLYNSLGIVSNRKEYDSKGSLKSNYDYEYYESGNLKKEIKTSGTDTQITNFISYDSKKNPEKLFLPNELTSIDLISNNNLLSFDETTFEYKYNESNYPSHIIERENNVIVSTKILEYN